MLSLKNNSLIIFLIAIISAIIFIPFIGNCPLFDWDEVNFAECAREMIVSGDYSQVQINFQAFWEKPPFFIWMQVLSMKLFGINEFAARFPNAVCGITSLISLFVVGKKFHSAKFGLIWVLIYASTLLPHFYFKSGIIDPWFNLFIFLSLYNAFIFLNNPFGKREWINTVLSGLFLGLAVLTKGPAALVIAALTITGYLIWSRQIKLLLTTKFFTFVSTTLFVAGSWFLIELLKGNQKIIVDFIEYQIRLFQTEDSGHSGPFVYHFIVLLIGCFPSSLIFIATYFNYKELTPYQKQLRKLFICLFWAVLLLFSIVQTKIIHYSSLCYFPLTFIASIGITQHFNHLKFNTVLKIIYWLIAGLIGIAFILIGFINIFKPYIIRSGLIQDEMAIQNLQADVHWTGFEFLIGLLFLLGSYYIYKSILKRNIKLFYFGSAINILFICLAIIVIIPKIELYTQDATIEFYKKCAKQNCYVETRGFKSYAYLFYSNRQKEDYTNPDQIASIKIIRKYYEKKGFSPERSYALCNLIWMQTGKIDRPAYVVIKTKNEEELLSDTTQTKLYSKNGFSFFMRKAVKPAK
jgi:4-amino-4-deoxy-L-arabinose transferase-like glycosyltransferase